MACPQVVNIKRHKFSWSDFGSSIAKGIFVALLASSASSSIAEEIAVLCKGDTTTFTARPGSTPTIKTEISPDQIFIIDEAKKSVWRWLVSLQQRDAMCADVTCLKTFTPTSIDLFWMPKSNVLNWEHKLKLDRKTGHGLWYFQHSRDDELNRVSLDMMCVVTPVPQAKPQPRAF